MAYLLAFALTLLVAVLVSERAHRGVLSTSVLFLAVAAGLGPLGVGLLSQDRRAPTEQIAELALFATLFNDGMRVDWQGVRKWRQPAALVLVIGMVERQAKFSSPVTSAPPRARAAAQRLAARGLPEKCALPRGARL